MTAEPITNAAAAIIQTPAVQPYFGQGGVMIAELCAMIILIATVFGYVTRWIGGKMDDLNKVLVSESSDRKAADNALETQINKVKDQTHENTTRIVQLESNYQHIKEGIEEIKRRLEK